jgi:chromosomal replication initiator protein
MEAPRPLDARELARLWQSVLGQLELELNPHTYSNYLRGTRALACDGAQLVVEARTVLSCEWLDRRMRVVIERAAAQALASITTVSFVAPGEGGGTVASAEAAPEPPAPRPKQALTIGTVNCGYTFESYLATRGNELALHACRSIVEPSDLHISPVVLWGSPGMGKTHLLHALACSAQALGKRVACLSADEFTNRWQGALRNHRAPEFQAEMRSVDLFIIDDLQAIAGRPKTIDELVWTMEEVGHNGGHVVTASERHPFELGLPERLESRLAAGIVTQVEPFEHGERREFIEHVARLRRTALPGWAADRIAAVPAPSVRALLGHINLAITMEQKARLEPRALDGALGGQVMLRAAEEAGERELLERVARCFAIALEDLTGKNRAARAGEARAVAAAALQARGYSLSRIGALFQRDKSTISTVASRGRAILAERADLERSLAG